MPQLYHLLEIASDPPISSDLLHYGCSRSIISFVIDRDVLDKITLKNWKTQLRKLLKPQLHPQDVNMTQITKWNSAFNINKPIKCNVTNPVHVLTISWMFATSLMRNRITRVVFQLPWEEFAQHLDVYVVSISS